MLRRFRVSTPECPWLGTPWVLREYPYAQHPARGAACTSPGADVATGEPIQSRCGCGGGWSLPMRGEPISSKRRRGHSAGTVPSTAGVLYSTLRGQSADASGGRRSPIEACNTYIYIYTCIYIYTHIYINKHTHAYIHTYIHTHLPTYLHSYMCVCVCVCVCVYVCMYVLIHVRMYACMNVCR
jgi:hypothetical protein